MSMLYRWLSLVVSLLGGMVAVRLFNRFWTKVRGEEHAPDARDLDRGGLPTRCYSAFGRQARKPVHSPTNLPWNGSGLRPANAHRLVGKWPRVRGGPARA